MYFWKYFKTFLFEENDCVFRYTLWTGWTDTRNVTVQDKVDMIDIL